MGATEQVLIHEKHERFRGCCTTAVCIPGGRKKWQPSAFDPPRRGHADSRLALSFEGRPSAGVELAHPMRYVPGRSRGFWFEFDESSDDPTSDTRTRTV